MCLFFYLIRGDSASVCGYLTCYRTEHRGEERESSRSLWKDAWTFPPQSGNHLVSTKEVIAAPSGRSEVVKNNCHGYLESILIVPSVAEAAVKPSFYTLLSGPRAPATQA